MIHTQINLIYTKYINIDIITKIANDEVKIANLLKLSQGIAEHKYISKGKVYNRYVGLAILTFTVSLIVTIVIFVARMSELETYLYFDCLAGKAIKVYLYVGYLLQLQCHQA